ncbi:uncharacterized protein LOC119373280 isoform X1 [Rhipicephalus sanguineus]|uniref:uncharacterized protein LOC119373280 isoform X1 n=1 Tax=Rhipicephalus sanguineus TaxID=34632 RepID=UPI00189362E4|nr:uncharacterized protein LOC119373280 isoform X1 [Rhipicephalus sanguineus]
MNGLLRLYLKNEDMWEYRSTAGAHTCTWRHRRNINETHVVLQTKYESSGKAVVFNTDTWKFFTSTTSTPYEMVLYFSAHYYLTEELLSVNEKWTCAVIKRTTVTSYGKPRTTYKDYKYYLYTSITNPVKAAKECQEKYFHYATHGDAQHYKTKCRIVQGKCS